MDRRLLLLIALALPCSLQAATVAHTFSEAERTDTFSIDPTNGEMVHGIIYQGESSLDLPYSVLGDDVLSLVWRAPATHYFELTTPLTGDTFLNVSTFKSGGGTLVLNGAHQDGSPSVTLAGPGPFPALPFGSVSLSGPGGNAVQAPLSERLTPGQVFRFSEITVQTTVPAAFDVEFSHQQTFVLEYGSRGATEDPSALRLVQIPEPTAALLASVGAAMIISRHRRQGRYRGLIERELEAE